MYCPFCHTEETKVIDSRLMNEGSQVRRRRVCVICQERFTTYETAELVMPVIIKRDGRREAFSISNLRQGLQKALQKRPISVEKIENCIDRIQQQLRACGEREVQSSTLGQWVMKELRAIDEVAYVRFASVYRRFQDVKDFNTEIHRLKSDNAECDPNETI